MPNTQWDVRAILPLSLLRAHDGVLGVRRWVWKRRSEIHAIAAPVFAALASFLYFTRFRRVTPLAAAAFFTAFIIILDAALVAPVFEKSYAMFGSILGTWLPFLSIFAATYLTGTWIVGRSGQRSGGVPGAAINRRRS